jgi:hypothetical protein
MTPRDERLDEARIDKELEALLGAAPSAELPARIRTRVATEVMASPALGVWGWWVFRGVAVAGVAVLLVMLLRGDQQVRPSRDVRAVPPVASAAAPVPRVPHVAESLGSPAATRTARLSRPSRSRAASVVEHHESDVSPVAPRDPFSDVQVSASELKALRQLDALFAGKQLKEDDAPRMAVRDDMTDLVIAPITIAPIQVASIKGDAE